uniref:Uncharacterized protein n=1 Tax=Arion vulgaris TaxID=1028688 RepID=A0A0B7BKC4_9EUPU
MHSTEPKSGEEHVHNSISTFFSIAKKLYIYYSNKFYTIQAQVQPPQRRSAQGSDTQATIKKSTTQRIKILQINISYIQNNWKNSKNITDNEIHIKLLQETTHDSC